MSKKAQKEEKLESKNAHADCDKAKKDFEIHHNDYHLVIKSGDDLCEVPEMYLQNLKTEGVL